MDATGELWGEVRKPWHHREAKLLPCDRCGTLVEPWPSWPVRLCDKCQQAVRDDLAWAPTHFSDGEGSMLPGGREVERVRREKLVELRAYWLQRGDRRAVSRVASWLARCVPSP